MHSPFPARTGTPANIVDRTRLRSSPDDMATPVTQAMKVREALPDASFMLWQGGKHSSLSLPTPPPPPPPPPSQDPARSHVRIPHTDAPSPQPSSTGLHLTDTWCSTAPVGHTIQGGASYDPDGVKQCTDRQERFWRTGKLPVDGFTCRNSEKLTWPPKPARAPQLKMETSPSSSM